MSEVLMVEKFYNSIYNVIITLKTLINKNKLVSVTLYLVVVFLPLCNS